MQFQRVASRKHADSLELQVLLRPPAWFLSCFALFLVRRQEKDSWRLFFEASRSFLPDLAPFAVQWPVRSSGERFYSFGIGRNLPGKKDGRLERCRNPRQRRSKPPSPLLEGEHYPTRTKSSETAEITGKLWRKYNRLGMRELARFEAGDGVDGERRG